MAGIREVAKRAGVSISTVSNVINGKGNVGEQTKAKILKICDEMQYIPHKRVSSSKKNESKTILFNFSEFDRDFYLKIIDGVNTFAKENDYDFIISTNKSCIKYMKPNITAGCISLDRSMESKLLLKVANSNYPIVTLDRNLPSPFIKSVLVNNHGAMYKLVDKIAKQGYKKFAFVGGPESTDDNLERYDAFKKALSDNNLNFKQESYYAGDYKEESGYRNGKIIMLSEKLPEVVVCANDSMAIGVIKAFRDHGIKVPEHIAVTGFDDCDMASGMKLTTVQVPNYERGYLAAQYLVANIEGHGNVDTFRMAAQVKWRGTVLEKDKRTKLNVY